MVDSGFRKDANEVLVKDGPLRLRQLVEDAEPVPLSGLHRFKDYLDEIMQYYSRVRQQDLGFWGGRARGLGCKA